MSTQNNPFTGDSTIDKQTGIDATGRATVTTADAQLGVETIGELLITQMGDTIQLIAAGEEAEVAVQVDRDELEELL